jgi:hypothetical protein
MRKGIEPDVVRHIKGDGPGIYTIVSSLRQHEFMDRQALDREDLRPVDHAGPFPISFITLSVSQRRYKSLIRKVAVQDLIDTPLDEALAKLKKRVAENKIALAVQAMESHKGRLALEQLCQAEAACSRYNAEYIAKQLRAREEELLREHAAKRARTRCLL